MLAKRIGDNVTLTIIRDKRSFNQDNFSKNEYCTLQHTKFFRVTNQECNTFRYYDYFREPNSIASQSGLQVGMIIKSLNRISTPDAVTFEKVYSQIKSGTEVLVFVAPQGDRYTTIIKE